MKRKLILAGIATLLAFGLISTEAKTTIVSWAYDMYDQVFIKAQEKGSMLEFPMGVVSVDGRVYEEQPAPMSWVGGQMMGSPTLLQNPYPATDSSLSNGKMMFDVYCAACHGDKGMAGTPITTKGMGAPPIKVMTPAFTDGYLYKKIKHGGINMPPLGYSTTDQERWDIINYIRVLEKG